MRSLIPWKRTGDTGLAGTSQYPLNRLRDEIATVFDQFFGRSLTGEPWGMEQFWGTDLEEKDNEVIVRAEAPGFEPAEFDISASGNVLTIRAEHKEGMEKEGEEKESRPRQWGYRRFERSVTLPTGVDAEKAEAHYRNGVLELHLPRTEEARPRRIAVKT